MQHVGDEQHEQGILHAIKETLIDAGIEPTVEEIEAAFEDVEESQQMPDWQTTNPVQVNGFQSDASKFGRLYEDHVSAWIESQGFTVIARRHRHESGVEFDLFVKDWHGKQFGVECKGSPLGANSPGMVRSDNRWKVFGYLYLLNKWRDRTGQQVRYILITSDLPPAGSAQRSALDLAELMGDLQVIELPSPTTGANA